MSRRPVCCPERPRLLNSPKLLTHPDSGTLSTMELESDLRPNVKVVSEGESQMLTQQESIKMENHFLGIYLCLSIPVSPPPLFPSKAH